ncbi:hypothetical protein HPB48_017545 [Haemaphysalis longicornis]|uniref:Uncharacterized protein n=1 Tax=Haemaphysalis longicornis TaxID=44386 RepID=A0A9J6GG59_HAELO|nr:hypothetical protein HPB48_017545 [Haemaphysalis longicornis]
MSVRQYAGKTKKGPKRPSFPREDIKIVLRPQNGFNVSKHCQTQLQDSIVKATGIGKELETEDTLRANSQQKTLVISTPLLVRAAVYGKIKDLSIGGSSYEVMAYAAPPEGTAKGVMRNITLFRIFTLFTLLTTAAGDSGTVAAEHALNASCVIVTGHRPE